MTESEVWFRSRHLELRITPDERDLICRAAAATATDVTEFALDNGIDAARRVLADRESFALDPAAVDAWKP